MAIPCSFHMFKSARIPRGESIRRVTMAEAEISVGDNYRPPLYVELSQFAGNFHYSSGNTQKIVTKITLSYKRKLKIHECQNKECSL